MRGKFEDQAIVFVPSGLCWISLLPAHSPGQPETQAGQTVPLPLPSPLPRRRLTRRARSCHCPSHRGGWDRQRGFSIRGTLSDAKRHIFAAGRISNERCSRTFLKQHKSGGPGSLCHCGPADPAPPASRVPRGSPCAETFPRHRLPEEGLLKLSQLRPAGTALAAPGTPAAAAARQRSPASCGKGGLPGGTRPREPRGSRGPGAGGAQPTVPTGRGTAAGSSGPARRSRHVFPKVVPRLAGPDAPTAGLGSAACGAARPRSPRPAAARG